MTRKVEYYAQCRKCGVDGVCPKCGSKIPRFSAFSDWLRNLPAPLDASVISNQNLDFIWHNYREDWFITIEEKQNGAYCRPAQWDTHGVIYQFLRIASEVLKMTKGQVRAGINSKRELRRVEYRGHYVISFEKTNPDDSGWINVNKQRVERRELMKLLETGHISKLTEEDGSDE